MNEEKYNLCVEKISENFSDEVKKINLEDNSSSFENFISPFNGLTDDEIEDVLEKQINEKLKSMVKISKEKKISDEEFKKYYRLFDDMSDSFLDKNVDYGLVEEADRIADNLFRISAGYKGRKIDYPVKLKYIKEYSIECIYSYDDIKRILYYILLELSIFDYILNNVSI